MLKYIIIDKKTGNIELLKSFESTCIELRNCLDIKNDLEKENKELRCCGNCKYYELNRGIICHRPTNNLCIHWYPNEVDAEDFWIKR